MGPQTYSGVRLDTRHRDQCRKLKIVTQQYGLALGCCETNGPEYVLQTYCGFTAIMSYSWILRFVGRTMTSLWATGIVPNFFSIDRLVRVQWISSITSIRFTLLARKGICEARLWVTLTHTAVEMINTATQLYEVALVSGVSWTVRVIKVRGQLTGKQCSHCYQKLRM